MAFYEQVNFGKGVLGKSLQDRTDMEIYQQAVFNAVNYIVTGQGTLKAQGLDYELINADEYLLSHLNASHSHVVLHEGNSEKYTVFTALSDTKPNRVVALTYSGLPTEANRIEVIELGFKASEFLFTLGKEVYFKNDSGILNKIEWFFSTGSLKYEARDVFTFPPVKLDATRLINVEGIKDKLDVAGLKYKYDPRTRYMEIAFTNPATPNVNITQVRISTNGWGFKNAREWVTNVQCISYQGDTFARLGDRLHAGNGSRTIDVANALSFKKIIISRDIDTDSGGRAVITVEYYNSVNGTWNTAIRDFNIKGGGDIAQDNLGVNPPSGDKPDASSLEPFFREYLFEIDISGNRGRFDKIDTYAPSTTVDNDPFPGLVKIIARYELTTNQGVDTLEYDYKNSKEQVVWVGTDPKYCFARKEFKEVYQADKFFFYQDRLIIAGIPNYEDTLIMSAINDFKDYSIRNMSSDAVITRFQSPRGKVVINGFSELASLIVYTNFGIWATPAKQMFTAGQNKFEFVNSLATEPSIQQSLAENIVIAGKNKNRLYQINYNDDSRKYTVKDLNIINNDILSGIRSIVSLDLGGQSEFTFIAIFGASGTAVLNLDDNENILGYTRMSLEPRSDFKGLLRILGVDYGWYTGGLAKVKPSIPDRSYVTFLIPITETEKGLLKYDDYGIIKGLTVRIKGDYACGVEFDDEIIEPALLTDESMSDDIMPVIDYDNSRPLFFRGLNTIPVNRKLTFFNEKVNDNNHEITSVLFEID